jgi:hypothetical protein
MRNPVLLPRWAALLALAMLIVAGNALAREKAITNTELERVADAVDGVESSHGMDASMWRAKPEGPQGPMQVSQKAATDTVGGTASTLARIARWGEFISLCFIGATAIGQMRYPLITGVWATSTPGLAAGAHQKS